MKKIFYETISAYFQIIVRIYFFFKKNGSVIQVGANNGSSNDLLGSIITRFKIKAILVEPLPAPAAELKEKYKNNSNVEIVEKVVSKDNAEESLSFFYLQEKEGLEYDPFYSQFSSLNRDHLDKFKSNIKDFDKLVTSVNIPCITINDLVKEYDFYKVDMIQTDVEGYDLELIRSIDFSKVNPAIIIFESMHIEKKELGPLKVFLKTIGYRCYTYGFDTLCINKSKIKFSDCMLRLIKVFKPHIF